MEENCIKLLIFPFIIYDVMGSKIEGKARALERRHAVHEELFCSDCGWFSHEYGGWCMKWVKKTDPRKWAKYGTAKKCDGFMRNPMKYTLFVGQSALLAQPTKERYTWVLDYIRNKYGRKRKHLVQAVGEELAKFIQEKERQEKERYAWVLSCVPYKYPKRKQKHVVQAVGEDNFILMELIPKEGNIPQVCERVYIGEGQRDIIDHVNRRLKYKDLTDTARITLPYALEKIVKRREEFFLEIFNNPDKYIGKMPILMLLPLIRMKDIENIRKERQKRKFKSFEDLERRTGLLLPEEAIARRIEVELIFRHG